MIFHRFNLQDLVHCHIIVWIWYVCLHIPWTPGIWWDGTSESGGGGIYACFIENVVKTLEGCSTKRVRPLQESLVGCHSSTWLGSRCNKQRPGWMRGAVGSVVLKMFWLTASAVIGSGLLGVLVTWKIVTGMSPGFQLQTISNATNQSILAEILCRPSANITLK